MVRQDYFTHFEQSQSLGIGREIPREKTLASRTHMWPRARFEPTAVRGQTRLATLTTRPQVQMFVSSLHDIQFAYEEVAILHF